MRIRDLYLFGFLLGQGLGPHAVLSMSVDFCPAPDAPEFSMPLVDATSRFPMQKYQRELNMQSEWLRTILDPRLVDESIEEELSRDYDTFPHCYFKRLCDRDIRRIIYWKVIRGAPRKDCCWLVEAIPWVTCSGTDPDLGGYEECLDSNVGLRCHPVYVYRFVWIWCERGPNRGFSVIKLPVPVKCTVLKYCCEQPP